MLIATLTTLNLRIVMTNRIVELNTKEVLAVSGGNETGYETIDNAINHIENTYGNIKTKIKETLEHIPEETWRYVIEPAITVGCFLFVAVVAYGKAKAAPIPKKLKKH